MGILNVTPDSFADTEPLTDVNQAVRRALELQTEGADLIDVGGESSRPGSDPVSADEEAARVLPVVRALGGRLDIPISVDTYKADVARRALAEGASLINDISGLRYDAGLGQAVADAGAGLIVMHMRGRPKTMYGEAHYSDVVSEVAAELRDSVGIALRAGIPARQVIVDPGIGFAKRAADSYGVLARLPELASALDHPVLVGPSRKSFMRDALEGRPAPDRDWGTAAAVTAAVLGGAHIVRVHNVLSMVQVVRTAEEIRRSWTG
jgi:dihydropteroate synthase